MVVELVAQTGGGMGLFASSAIEHYRFAFVARCRPPDLCAEEAQSREVRESEVRVGDHFAPAG